MTAPGGPGPPPVPDHPDGDDGGDGRSGTGGGGGFRDSDHGDPGAAPSAPARATAGGDQRRDAGRDAGSGEQDDAGEAASGAPGDRRGPPQIDVRFSYANERTFLAWNRTALALVTAGLAITQLLPPFSVPGGRRMIGMPLIVLGIVLAIASLRQWRKNEEAMHRREPLPPSPLPLIVAVVIAVSALVAAVLAIVGGPA